MSDIQKPVLLVTGASGHLGRRVVELLLEAASSRVIATTRTPEKLADLAARGVEVRAADFADPASMLKAFAGADRLLLISTDAIGQRVAQHQNAIKAAEAAGVRHIVYTSIVNPTPDSRVFVAAEHRATEEALAASNVDWTALRNNIYADMLPRSLSQAVQMGAHYSAAGEGRTAYITREDCARAAAAALASAFNGRRALDITGPEAVSQAELAAIASELSGRSIAYVPIELETLIQNMVGAGLPRPVAEIYASFDAGIAANELSGVSSAFEELTGQKPTRVADFLAAHRAVFSATAV